MNSGDTYDYICFTDLIYESASVDRKKIESKIKRRLKSRELGAYDQERVDYIRNLKNELHQEISLASKSKYFRESVSQYAEMSDFDIEQLTTDYHLQFSLLSKGELASMIGYAVHYYHTR